MMEKTGQNSEFPARNANRPVILFPLPSGFYTIPNKEEVQNKADISVAKSETDTAQVTIFYGGQILVFNDFPADKAKEIMLLTSKGSPLNAKTSTPNMIPKPAESANSFATPTSSVHVSFGNGLVQENLSYPSLPTCQ